MCTKFGVDGSSGLSFIARTDKHTDTTTDGTDHPSNVSATDGVGTGQ